MSDIAHDAFEKHITLYHNELIEIRELLKSALTRREDIDRLYPISSTFPYVVDYKERDKLFLFSPVAITLQVEDYGTISIPANVWTDISFPTGYRLTPTQTTIVNVNIRATDLYLPSNFINLGQIGGAAISLGQKTMANSFPVVIASDQSVINTNVQSGVVGLALPAGATPINVSVVGGANAAASATLTGAALKFTYLTSFFITVNAAATAATATLTGVPGGPLNYEIVGQGDTTMSFSIPLQSSAVNTNIVFSVPALGAAVTAVITLTGYLL